MKLHKNKRKQMLLGMAMLGMACAPGAMAFTSAHYAKSSKLATGKWVKIKVPTTGVYELTAFELAEMGFSDISQVRIYGSGGNQMSEVLDGTAPDDLQQVPLSRYNNKIVFYGKGPVNVTMTDANRTNVRFQRTINAYSNYGYYFVTDQGAERSINEARGNTQQATESLASSINWYYHEKELSSVSQTGKDLLGEAYEHGQASFDYDLPGLCPDSAMNVNVNVAALVTKDGSGGKATCNQLCASLVAPRWRCRERHRQLPALNQQNL